MTEARLGHEEHRRAGARPVRVFVLTASDTRGEADDASGAYLKSALASAGHVLAGYRVVRDEPDEVRRALAAAGDAGAEAVVVNGGTGISGRDRTYEAVAGLLEKRLDGFGEIFRALSFQEIGSAAMLSRAVAGTWEGRVIFSVPGSIAAVRLAWERLIGPELGHVAFELSKHASPPSGPG